MVTFLLRRHKSFLTFQLWFQELISRTLVQRQRENTVAARGQKETDKSYSSSPEGIRVTPARTFLCTNTQICVHEMPGEERLGRQNPYPVVILAILYHGHLLKALEERDLDLCMSLSLVNIHSRYQQNVSNEWIKEKGRKQQTNCGRGEEITKRSSFVHLSLILLGNSN